jgi:alkaline phosphatase D
MNSHRNSSAPLLKARGGWRLLDYGRLLPAWWASVFFLFGLAGQAMPQEGRMTGEVTLTSRTLQRIAFGSCARQDLEQPIWEAILATKPDLFLLIGDAVYADSTDPLVLRKAYARLSAKPGFAKLRREVPLLATWDDHDYGVNDGGAEHPRKAEAQKEFLDFLNEPEDSPRRKQKGVYQAKVYGAFPRRVQVILLDTRYNRGPLTRLAIGDKAIFLPNRQESVSMLGEEQWTWLRQQLRVPAELRLLVSSIQVIPNEHPFEKWGNLPHERERLFSAIRNAAAEGVIILSGDQHFAEVSRLEGPLEYPLVEYTSSGMTHTRGSIPAPNSRRIGAKVVEKNFGLIVIDWDKGDTKITFSVRSETGDILLEHLIALSDLQIAAN